MNRFCQSIKVEMNEDLSLRGCKINKITLFHQGLCLVLAITLMRMRVNILRLNYYHKW